MSRRIPSISRLILGSFLVLQPGGVALAQTTASSAALDRFVGTWREDESKRQIGSMRHLIFRRSGAGIEEERGSEARPLIQPIRFGAKPYNVEGPNFIEWRQLDANRFERDIRGPGGLINTRRISISPDGKTLTEVTDQKTTDGQPLTTTIVYQRVSGDASGLVGRWKPLSFKSTRPAQVKYERAGPNALRFSDDIGGGYPVTLDDKPVVVGGLAPIPGSMISTKLVDERTIETTSSRAGVTTARGKRTLSADGRTLTVTAINVGPNASTEPSVTVYVKQ